ncbi:hypothetical protein HD554DRAFT_2038050 [Boletus coccyginus]|nr:hypothetical protein HD554DRAFT_2038050 [Boletus coccyginus]
MPVVVRTLEEGYTPTTVEAAFVFHPLPPNKAFSFSQHGSPTRGNTSIHAQLSLAVEQYDCDLAEECTPLGAMEAHTSLLKVPLETLCILPPQPNKVWLNATISDCPLANGLLEARSDPANDPEVRAQLIRQSGGDRLDFDYEDEDEDEASSPPVGVILLLLKVNNQKATLKGPAALCPTLCWMEFAAHRTWHAFVWYCYSGDLEFTKLKSQLEPGVWHLRVTPLEGGLPACSPKSMYRLADLCSKSSKVGDEDLKAKAPAAIEESLTEANILDGTFSVFTSKSVAPHTTYSSLTSVNRYPDVRKVQFGVLMNTVGHPRSRKHFSER